MSDERRSIVRARRLRVVARCSLAGLVLCAGASMAAEPPVPPRRVVSINLCTDQYLLALADRDQIAALTRFAADPELSVLAREASGIPSIAGTAEEVIRLEPDLVLAGTFTRRETRQLLRRLGYALVEVPPAKDFDDVRRTARALAGRLGHPRRGERLVAALDHRLATLDAVPAQRAPTALYYQRRGFANGADSLASEIMRAAGLRNLAADLGLHETGRVSLERVIRAQPDFLILESLRPRLEDEGSYLLRHPALRVSVSPQRRLALPRALVVCGGPATVEAIDHLVTALRARRAAAQPP